MNFSANLNVMVKAARAAARSLVKDFREVENLQVSAKGPGDFVSRADIAAERIVRDLLMGARPNYGWTGEESEPIPGKDPTRRWLVDPLDGTTNFLHGLPHWCVSIGLEHKGEAVAGVVYDPVRDELFVAEKGQGAWMNQTRLRVSGRTRLIESIFSTNVPASGRPGLPGALQDLARISPATSGIRQWGATALDLAYVAAGRTDGHWQKGANPWDLCAGLAILREAGGMAEPVRDGRSILGDGEIITSGGGIFDSFAAIVRNA
jgi:myo-inositol-1(or 4)-monophosphatase